MYMGHTYYFFGATVLEFDEEEQLVTWPVETEQIC
jgi:hypothetical protein